MAPHTAVKEVYAHVSILVPPRLDLDEDDLVFEVCGVSSEVVSGSFRGWDAESGVEGAHWPGLNMTGGLWCMINGFWGFAGLWFRVRFGLVWMDLGFGRAGLDGFGGRRMT